MAPTGDIIISEIRTNTICSDKTNSMKDTKQIDIRENQYILTFPYINSIMETSTEVHCNAHLYSRIKGKLPEK